nr:adenylate/guanylate cyclase domain-containing protein [Antrihabitans sp. YC2-6]
MLGGPAEYTLDDVCARVGISRSRGGRLWMALGFTVDPDPKAAMFTAADVDAFQVMADLVEKGIVDDPTQLAIARTLGHSMARVAEWQVDVLNAHLAQQADPKDGEAVARQTISSLQELQNYAWRRHLAAAADRSTHDLETDSENRTLAVGFADIVGYTRLTRHLDTAELAALIETFESGTTETITGNGGWVIKNVGDEVMFAAERPADIAAIAFGLADQRMDPEHGDVAVPPLRIGLSYGPVLQRFGDLYGPVVNIAARLTGVARPGTILVDSGLASKLTEVPGARLVSLRPVRVRGISRLRAHVLRRD